MAVARLLLTQQADVNRQCRPKAFTVRCLVGAYRDVGPFRQNSEAAYVFTEAPGSTSLHMAWYYGHSDLCQELLKHRTDIQLKNSLHHTPLHLARTGGHAGTLVLSVTLFRDRNPWE